MNDQYAPIIKVLAEDFEIPQLGKKRKITALLPYDYEDSNEHFPVLYLQDGQNLFDPNAPFGNWSIDKALATMAAKKIGKMIVVAIDHGGRERIEEYTPFIQSKFGVGKGRKYLQFVTDTLKPYVDKNYRSKGLGELLLKTGLNFSKTRHWKKIEVGAPNADEWPRTIKFYQENGFSLKGPKLRIEI